MKKKIILGVVCLCTLLQFSCTPDEVKEISGTIMFNDVGQHSFNINADNIVATITIAAPNYGEKIVLEEVEMYRTANYNVKIGVSASERFKTELRNNLVLMYEAHSHEEAQAPEDIFDPGYIRIDWKGLN